MKDVRRSVAGAAMSGALAVFTALAPAEAAEPVGEFRVGNIWKGSAGFYGPGNSFSGCDMTATFPEGLVLSFSLNAKGVLGLGMSGPDDMSLSSGKVPTTLSVDGSVLRMVAMEADDDALMFDELWLDAVLGPAGDYLPALKRGKSITLAMQGQTVDKPSKNRVWTYTAALTGAAEAFQALEACVAKYATGGRPAAAPGTATKAARYGAIAMGQDDEEAVLTGVSDDQPSLALAAKDAIATCRKAGKGKDHLRNYRRDGPHRALRRRRRQLR